MPLGTHPPESDLHLPLPADGEAWDPHTIHTHYFGLEVAEAGIGAFIYFRYMPAFPLSQGGITAYRGMNNLTTVEAAYHDYEVTMPWPEIAGNKITLANGLAVEFPEPGRRAILTYASADRSTRLEVEASAVTPLVARGHVMPGEEHHFVDESGGTEQFMHYTGELTLHGEAYEVDCHYPRDRSWRQVRTESREGNLHPPICWTPMYFGEDLAFNQVGLESPDSGPDWAGVYDLPDDAPTFHFAWVDRGEGAPREITSVRRSVTESNPVTLFPTRMEIEARDEAGESYSFSGEAVAYCPIMMWPNICAYDSVYRWESADGRVAHGTMQGMHVEAYAHALKDGRGDLLGASSARSA